jgi:hypothetical protein
MEKTIQFINQNSDKYVKAYDLNKYPPNIYQKAKKSFSSLSADAEIIKLIMEWKWGHVRKPNYPSHHKQLIKDIINSWKGFLRSNHDKSSAKQNFDWWHNKLAKRKTTRFISIAFIVHLIHHREIPLIDQHNYRALNFLTNNLKLSKNFKKSPSNWNDIIMLKQFTDEVLPNLSNKNPEDFDKFLMMFGKSIKNNK